MATTANPAAQGGTASASGHPARLTALYRQHLARGAELVSRDGWLLPLAYGTAAQERTVLRTAVGLLDIGESGKIDLKSRELTSVVAAAFPGVGAPAIGMSIATKESVRICRLTADRALLLTTPARYASTFEAVQNAANADACTHLTDLTGSLCGLRLLGPHAPLVLQRLTSLDLGPDRFADAALAQGGIARVHGLVIRRDLAGLLGYDLYVDRDLGSYLWDALLDEGRPLGIAPVGRSAEEGLV